MGSFIASVERGSSNFTITATLHRHPFLGRISCSLVPHFGPAPHYTPTHCTIFQHMNRWQEERSSCPTSDAALVTIFRHVFAQSNDSISLSAVYVLCVWSDRSSSRVHMLARWLSFIQSGGARLCVLIFVWCVCCDWHGVPIGFFFVFSWQTSGAYGPME